MEKVEKKYTETMYKEDMNNFLMKTYGTTDVSNIEFKQIDENTRMEDLDFKKVSGDWRLAQGKVKLPYQITAIVEKFLATPLP